ncbi:MAG: T9SS type A sorting domain-containing protein [Muribaculaceae bacterium]|nr:T9SS type A sorting domain-containing protein [Muribaculaceae bacterium]
MKKQLLLTVAFMAGAMMSANALQSVSSIDNPTMLEVKASKDISKSSLYRVSPLDQKSGISIKEGTLELNFRRPIGTYYWDADFTTGKGYPVIQGPAYVESEWLNLSKNATAATPWSWIINTKEVSTESNFKNTFPAGLWYPCSLASGATTFELPGFSYYQSGGVADPGSGVVSDLVRYSPFSEALLSYLNIGILCNDPVYLAKWPSVLANFDITATDVTLEGPVQKFEKTTNTMVINGFNMTAVVQAKAGATLNMTVRKLSDEGEIGEVLGTGTCVLETAVDELAYQLINFKVKSVDELGFELDKIIINNTAFVVEISGYVSNPDWVDFRPTMFGCDRTIAENNGEFSGLAHVKYKNAQGVEEEKFFNIGNLIYATKEEKQMRGICFLIGIQAEMPYIGVVSEKDASLNEFTYQGTGADETKDFIIDTNVDAENLILSEANDNDIPSWVVPTKEDIIIHDDDSNQDVPYVKVSFQISALPAGTSGRTANIKVYANGMTKVFHLVQGDGSVSGVEVNPVSVATVGGNFVATYPSTVNSVKIFNVAGQLVKDVELDAAGKTTIDAQSLSNGVYILKFNDNFTVKAVK